IPGSVAFQLHDTFGFPVELTEEIAADRGLTVDRTGFEAEMKIQRDRARAAFKADHGGEVAEVYRSALRGVPTSEFVGYDHLSAEGVVLSMVVEGSPVRSAGTDTPVELFVDVTPFYAESGGQVGDRGVIRTETGVVEVTDTQFVLPGIRGHRGMVVSGEVLVGQDAVLDVEPESRERTRKNHTGTHILHWALRDTIGDHVHQAGSLVAPDRLRFDFSHFEAVDRETLGHVERTINERIIANDAVTTIETSQEEAKKMGALAFFGDKYGPRVRVVRTGDFSTEFCGGTHVPSTGQVGPFVLVAESSVGSNIRRVEALTGSAAYHHLTYLRDQLHAVSSTMRTPTDEVVTAARSLTERLRDAEQRIAEFEERDRAGAAVALVDGAEIVGETTLVSGRVDGIGGDGARSLAFQIRDRTQKGIGIVGSVTDGKASLIVFVTDDVAAKGVSAGDIASAGARVLGGGGSRDPKLAQAGGPNASAMDEALVAATDAAREALIGS
ncbi:MAG: alanine--tRNA ligase, partial [Acidimicrobiia bacterium]|nr:alanine--tRNA ligase [Acidimicrobiia bacterium]